MLPISELPRHVWEYVFSLEALKTSRLVSRNLLMAHDAALRHLTASSMLIRLYSRRAAAVQQGPPFHRAFPRLEVLRIEDGSGRTFCTAQEVVHFLETILPGTYNLKIVEIANLVKPGQSNGLSAVLQCLAASSLKLQELVLPQLTSAQLSLFRPLFTSLLSIHIGALPPDGVRGCSAVKATPFHSFSLSSKWLGMPAEEALHLGAVAATMPRLQHFRAEEATPLSLAPFPSLVQSLAILNAVHSRPTLPPQLQAYSQLRALQLQLWTHHSTDQVTLSLLHQLPPSLEALVLAVRQIDASPPAAAAAAVEVGVQLQPSLTSVLMTWASSSLSSSSSVPLPNLAHITLSTYELVLPGDAGALHAMCPMLQSLVVKSAASAGALHLMNSVSRLFGLHEQRHPELRILQILGGSGTEGATMIPGDDLCLSFPQLETLLVGQL